MLLRLKYTPAKTPPESSTSPSIAPAPMPKSRRSKPVEPTASETVTLDTGRSLTSSSFAFGVYLFTRTGREGLRIQRMEEERQTRVPPE